MKGNGSPTFIGITNLYTCLTYEDNLKTEPAQSRLQRNDASVNTPLSYWYKTTIIGRYQFNLSKALKILHPFSKLLTLNMLLVLWKKNYLE